MKNNKEEERYRKLKEAWDKIEKFFRKDYPAILLGALFTAAIAFSILSYKQRKGKEAFFVSKANILGEKAGSVSAVATVSSTAFTEAPSSNSVKIPAASPATPTSVFPININTAAADILDQLPGISPAVAGNIVQFRQTHGLFKNVQELIKVSGIKEKRFAVIKDLVTVGE